MNTHLYIVQHEIAGERHIDPCVGDIALALNEIMAKQRGARILNVVDLEFELRCFVWDCCFEGLMKDWAVKRIEET